MSVRQQGYISLKHDIHLDQNLGFFKTIWIQSMFDLSKIWSGRWSKFPIYLSGFFWFFTTVGALRQLQAKTILPVDYWDVIEGFIEIYLRSQDGAGGTLVMLAVSIMASGVIADDLGKRGIILYGPKLSQVQYALSKLLTVGIVVFLALPMWLLLFLIIVWYKTEPPLIEIINHYSLITNILIMMIIYTIIFGSVALSASAITDRGLIAGVLTLVYILASDVLGSGLLYDLTQVKIFYVISPIALVDYYYKKLFDLEIEVTGVFWWAILVTLVYVIITAFLVTRAIKKGVQR